MRNLGSYIFVTRDIKNPNGGPAIAEKLHF
jgi:hypothetical protein